MRSAVGLCVLGLLCLHSSVFGQEAMEVQPGVPIFCDDATVEKAVKSAVHKFNEKLTTGNKLALFQILTASKSESGSGSVYSLHFTSRRSNCPAGSNTTWTGCNYLPVNRRPISCNATVYVTETEEDTRQVDCLLEDHISPEKAHCLGCPEKIDGNSEDLKDPLFKSISKYNSISNSTYLFNLHNVGFASRQVVAGFRYVLRFDMQKTICLKVHHQEPNKECVPDEQDVKFTNCNSTVDVAPWRHEPLDPMLECDDGALPMVLSRRRPPGWSPLRNLLFDVSPTGSLTPKKAAKEESSEEDTTGSKLTASPDLALAADAVTDSPFHCPSKPWKPFNPVHLGVPAAPTEATTLAAST